MPYIHYHSVNMYHSYKNPEQIEHKILYKLYTLYSARIAIVPQNQIAITWLNLQLDLFGITAYVCNARDT